MEVMGLFRRLSGGHCIVKRSESPDEHLTNPNHPHLVVAVPANSGYPARVFETTSKIFAVCFSGYGSKVDQPVVGSVTVDVIDLIRHFAMNEIPNDPMGKIRTAQQFTVEVASMMLDV